MADAVPIQASPHFWQLKDRFELGSEREPAFDRGIVERLDAQTIPGQEKLAASLVPEREGKHAAKAIDRARAELLIEMNNRFGVALSAERVSPPFELPAQIAVVVDFSVKDDPDGAVLVGDRLLPTCEVDDAQPPHAEGHAVPEVHPLVVRSAMDHRGAHGAYLVLEGWASVPPDDAGNTTHDWALICKVRL